MYIPKKQFDCAVDSMQLDPWPEIDTELSARITAAVCGIIKHRQGVPDDVEWIAPPEHELKAMVREFLAGINSTQRRKLKGIAEGLTLTREALH